MIILPTLNVPSTSENSLAHSFNFFGHDCTFPWVLFGNNENDDKIMTCMIVSHLKYGVLEYVILNADKYEFAIRPLIMSGCQSCQVRLVLSLS